MLWKECEDSSVNAIVFDKCGADEGVAVFQEDISILQTFKGGSVSLLCAA